MLSIGCASLAEQFVGAEIEKKSNMDRACAVLVSDFPIASLRAWLSITRETPQTVHVLLQWSQCDDCSTLALF